MGARFLGGPLAGAGRLPPPIVRDSELARSAPLRALCRRTGYGIGYGFGDAIHEAVGPLGYVALGGIFTLTLVIAALPAPPPPPRSP